MELGKLCWICFVWSIYLHLFMKFIRKDKMMCHTKTMWLHGVI
uniref:Hda102 n=1 Tax=Arundo donax TaxID=35708 RepID=A0A0A9E6C1_ARUDO